jgi:hypothetical protein
MTRISSTIFPIYNLLYGYYGYMPFWTGSSFPADIHV